MASQTMIIKFATNDRHFEKHKDNCINDGSIGLGYGVHIPLNMLSRAEIDSIENPLGAMNSSMIKFIHDLKIGDIIWAMQGRKNVLYTGVVTSNYYFTSDPRFLGYNHRRHVKFTQCPPGSEVSNGGYLTTISKVNTNVVAIV